MSEDVQWIPSGDGSKVVVHCDIETLKSILRDWMELRMGEISEECYCAGWMMGLEEFLWEHSQSLPEISVRYGQGTVSRAHLEQLRCASKLLGEWPTFDETSKPPVRIEKEDGSVAYFTESDLKWVSLDEWKKSHPSV